MGLARRLGQVGKAVRLAVVLILVAAGASFIAFVVWREPGQVSGSLTDVAEEVSPGPYRVGEFIVSLETGQRQAPQPVSVAKQSRTRSRTILTSHFWPISLTWTSMVTFQNPPRSGHVPKIVDIRGVTGSGGATPGDWTLAVVIEHQGHRLDGIDVAKRALSAWEQALRRWNLL
jgi:hypothetical protein